MSTGISETDLAKLTNTLKAVGSSNLAEADAALEAIVAELQTPLRQGVLTGDIIGNIFTKTVFDPAARTEYPVDFYRTDNANEYVAFATSQQGDIPGRLVSGDYVTVPTYPIGHGIDFLIRYAKEARWDIMARAMEVLEAGIVKKKNDDGWHNILAAAVDRNVIVNDSNASAGQFTKRLVSTMKTFMRRNGGGNSTSTNRAKLTHIFMSPEAMEDIRNWSATEADDFTRREAFLAEDGSLNKVFGTMLIDLDELGTNQLYELYFETTLGGSLPSGDVEIVVGLDLSKNDSFVHPVRQELEILTDPTVRRARRVSMWAEYEGGFGVLNGARVMLGSL